MVVAIRPGFSVMRIGTIMVSPVTADILSMEILPLCISISFADTENEAVKIPVITQIKEKIYISFFNIIYSPPKRIIYIKYTILFTICQR